MSDDDLSSLLKRREHARPTRTTYVLLTLLILIAGFIGGAFAQQRFGSTSASGFPGSFPALPAGIAFPGAGAGSAAGAAGAGVTVGTVKLVDGRHLYITTTDGATVKVTVPESASVTSQTPVTLTDLASGTSVLIQGESAADGTVTATSVSQQGATPAPTTQGAN